MIITEEEYLAHYGILRKSGRYPWGSGGPEKSGANNFLAYVETLKNQGLSEKQIAEGFKTSIARMRAAKTIALAEQKQMQIAQAQRLKDKGWSNVKIGERMGINESVVRSLLAPGAADKAQLLDSVSSMLEKEVAEKRFVMIGAGVEHHINVSRTRLDAAVAMLQEKGYEVRTIQVPQHGTNQKTKVKVLAPPGTSWGEVMKNRGQIQQIGTSSDDGGRTFANHILPPLSISPKRVGIRYAEDGGANADGVIYVRRGVKDVSLGQSQYAQVRIKVGNGHYLKGMAMYKDDMPDGVDLLFNTNKSDTGNWKDALKPLSDDPDLPFGAVIKRQNGETNRNGERRLTSVMNIVNEEGDWTKWSRTLSSQMLSKQSPTLAKQQLAMAYEHRQREYERISQLTNPTVRRKLLEQFGDDATSASVNLKAAALPRQASHVILPIDSMPPTQIYAPNYQNGDRVVLIRHPHGGTFEIPELTVNNRHPEAKRLLGNAPDAVGIHKSVADRLSGADFDGDTVIVIPNKEGRVKTTPALDGLKNFDPQSYKNTSIPKIKPETKQNEMGVVSNLITDMTIQGASPSEIARAVRHSMVVIDSEKHHLDYKRSALENGIPALKAKYQGGARAGAATLISRAGAQQRVPDRIPRPAREGGPIDKETGRRVFKETGATYVNAQGKTVVRTNSSKKLAETEDAHTLSSGTPIERLYADHSNRMKELGNRARRDSVNTPRAEKNASAAKVYSAEVSRLNSALVLAERNAPLERQARLIADQIVRAKKEANPFLEPDQLKKIQTTALAEARTRTGAKKTSIIITPKEWEAIQAGAISDSKLSKILTHADMDTVRELATPRIALKMTSSDKARASAMFALGYTRAEVARQLGVSLSTLDLAVQGSEQ